MRVRLMSFNIQHARDFLKAKRYGGDPIDFDLMAEAIKSQNPDIVVLNEVRNAGPCPTYKNQTKILAKKAGYEYYEFGEAIRFTKLFPYGNAILSKHPIEEFKVVHIPDPPVKDEDAYYETRCVMKCKININGKYLNVLGTHIGLAKSEQINAVKTLVELIDTTSTPCALLGDFNMTPDDEKLVPIYDRLIDTAEFFDEPKLTFPSDEPNIKIDYIFVSKDVKVIYADVPDIVASDHRLHICDIEI